MHRHEPRSRGSESRHESTISPTVHRRLIVVGGAIVSQSRAADPKPGQAACEPRTHWAFAGRVSAPAGRGGCALAAQRRRSFHCRAWLEKEGLGVVMPEARIGPSLIRRLKFDLLGLPPVTGGMDAPLPTRGPTPTTGSLSVTRSRQTSWRITNRHWLDAALLRGERTAPTELSHGRTPGRTAIGHLARINEDLLYGRFAGRRRAVATRGSVPMPRPPSPAHRGPRESPDPGLTGAATPTNCT